MNHFNEIVGWSEYTTESLTKYVLEKTSFQRIRIIPPGSAVTMDFDLNRLNIYTDESNTIVRTSNG
jgi:hypothetical protein